MSGGNTKDVRDVDDKFHDAESPEKSSVFDQFTFHGATSLNGEEKSKLLQHVSDALEKDSKVPSDGVETTLCLILHAMAIRGTTQKAPVPMDDEQFITAKVGKEKVPITITNRAVCELFASRALDKLRTPNRPRSFCRTFADEYVVFAEQYISVLGPVPRANDLGIVAAKSYLAADFIDTSVRLGEIDQAILMRARDVALGDSKRSGTSITSLKQLGLPTLA